MWTGPCSACGAADLSTVETESFFWRARIWDCLEKEERLFVWKWGIALGYSLGWDATKKSMQTQRSALCFREWFTFLCSGKHNKASGTSLSAWNCCDLWNLQFSAGLGEHLFWPCIVFFILFSSLRLINFICFGLISFFTGLTTSSIEVLSLSMSRVCQYKAFFCWHASMCFQSDLGGIFSGVKAQQGLHASISYLAFLTQLTRMLIIAI